MLCSESRGQVSSSKATEGLPELYTTIYNDMWPVRCD